MNAKGFTPATRQQAKARIALAGPAKSGKTFTGLRIARYLGERIAVIDTERRSASKYVGEPEIPPFDVLELQSFSPDAYIEAIEAAATARYPVLLIDSISHAWMGAGGVLEIVDTTTARSQAGNAYTSGWREATPMHNKLVEAMLSYPGHLIVTVRTKSRYVMETNRQGKQVPKKVGMEWVQRDGMEYEFDVVGELDQEHTLVVRETRCRALDGAVFAKPGQEFAQPIVDWLASGAAVAWPTGMTTTSTDAPSETARPFVDSSPQTPVASTAAQAQTLAPQSASGNVSSDAGAEKPTKTEQTPPPDRKPIEKLNQQECVFRLQDELKRLKANGQDSSTVQYRTDLLTSVFGTAIDTVAKASQQGKSAIQKGLVKLAAMQPEVPPVDPFVDSSLAPVTHDAGELGSHGIAPTPPAPSSVGSGKEDVPDSPPPDGSIQESLSLPLGETIAAGPSPDGEATSASEPFIDTLLRPDGVEMDEPPEEPTMAGMVVDMGDVRTLLVWANMNGQQETFEVMAEGKPVQDGTPILSRIAYKVIRDTIKRSIGVTA